MDRKHFNFTIVIAAISFVVILMLITGLWRNIFYPEEEDIVRTRIVMPSEDHAAAERPGNSWWYEGINTRLPLYERESAIAVLNIESEGGFGEDQFVIYRNLTDPAAPIHITFIGFDQRTRTYQRMWSVPLAAARPETISLFSQDLIGDRNNCIIVTGMNAQNEHTMTIFRRTPGQPIQSPFRVIAEIQIAGSIVIQEVPRSLAYHQGIALGASFNIASYGPDPASANILDQIETIYSFSASSQRYEQVRVSRIPGAQIEQRRLRELLSGAPSVFENFIDGLWYFVTPQGTIDTEKLIYFDTARREIIFYGDDVQQVFMWQSSTPTRYGLYIRTQNNSIRSLRRSVNIELESLESIRIRVNQDAARIRVAFSTVWDSSFRRATTAVAPRQDSQINGAVNALYDSSWGRIEFHDTGEFSISSGGAMQTGRYVFFNVNGDYLLELRHNERDVNGMANRLVFRVENSGEQRVLSHVRLTATGVQNLHEPSVTLTPVD
ncbi:MAG: pallilysin-related adhesin [Treponema sp.]|nr:pallilysin-related adhesin [Treponema sp.]